MADISCAKTCGNGAILRYVCQYNSVVDLRKCLNSRFPSSQRRGMQLYNPFGKGSAATLPPDVLQHRRGRCVILQCNRLCVSVDDDFRVDRCLALSRSFGVEPQFDNRKVVIRSEEHTSELQSRSDLV